MDGESHYPFSGSNLELLFPLEDDPSFPSSTPFLPPPPPAFLSRGLAASSPTAGDVSMENSFQGEAGAVDGVEGSSQAGGGEGGGLRTELNHENEDTSTSNHRNSSFRHQPSSSEHSNSLSAPLVSSSNPFRRQKPEEMDVELAKGPSPNHLPIPPAPAGPSSLPSQPSAPNSSLDGSASSSTPQHPFNPSSSTLPEPEQPVASTSSLPPPPPTGSSSSRPTRTSTSIASAAELHRRAARGISKPEPEPEPEPPSEVTLTIPQKRKLVARKQEEITRVMSRHDDLVRQAFHMEKFVDMVSFDPTIAKQDMSAVFLQWAEPYNLLANLAAASAGAGNESPGGSSKPLRTTRRQITERKESLAVPLDKGKGKARALYGSFPYDDDEIPSPSTKSARKGRKHHLTYPLGGASSSMLPPPFPKSSNKKRPSSALAYDLDLDDDDDLFPLPPPKKLKYLAFDPPSYTHIDHIPSKPNHSFSLTKYLSSITFLTPDDLPIVITHPQGTPTFLEKQARKEAVLQNKIASLQALGRLGSVANTMGGGRRAPPNADGRKTELSRHEAMLEHLPFVQRGVVAEGKAKVAGAKKVGKLIVGYWEREGGREERERKDEERLRKNGARALGKMIRGKWRLAVNAVRAKLKEEEQRERERLGKEHLDAMLERSGGLLDRRREDLVGVGLEREGEDQGNSVDGQSADSGSRSGSASGSDEEQEEDGSEEEKEAGSSDEEEEEEEEDDELRLKGDSRSISSEAAAPSPSTPLDLEESSHDPRDADVDVEFNPTSVEVTAEEDQLLELEMEAAEDEEPEDDSEDEGLLNDADLPIEELMARYGYGAPGADGEAANSDDESEEQEDEDEDGEEEEEDEEGEDDAAVEIVIEEEDEAVPATPPPVEAFSPEPASIQELEPATEDVEEHAGSDQMDVDDEQAASSRGSDSSEEESDSDSDEDGMEVTRSNALVDDEEDPDHPEGAPPKIRTPFLFRGNLRPYQQAGLEWLASLYNNETNGILADEMGLGKTIQTISLLSYLACEKGMWGPHLIVVPTSVILNWEMEFKKFFPGFKVMTYYGNQRDRKEKRRGWNTENAFNVCITSYQLVLADQHIFRRKPWHYLILDEAHNVKNFRSQRWQTLLGFNAQRRLLLTGTPLQNNLMELWSLLYFLMPAGMQAEGTGFANHKEFSEWFSNPMDKAIESGGQMSDEAKATITRLHTLLRPYLLRRLKADVEKQLPGKFEHVVYCRLAKRQRFLYDEFMSRSQTRETLTSGNFLSIANCLMQLRKVCNHPDLFEVRPIVTSFAMPKSVAAEFEIKELFVRRKLLAEDDSEKLDLDVLNLTFTNHEASSKHASRTRSRLDGSHLLPLVSEITSSARDPPTDTRTIAGWKRFREHQLHVEKVERWKHIAYLNQLRCQQTPIYGDHLISLVSELGQQPHLVPLDIAEKDRRGYFDRVDGINALIKSNVQRAEEVSELITKFAVIPPNAVAGDLVRHALPTLNPSHPALSDPSFDSLHHSAVAHQIAFPDASLLQYDCGKLQKLFDLLRERKAGGHRVLIFTQMTKVLDILEIFLNHHGHRYLRLDGSTKIEDRQIITERFNTDDRIFCFIASSRSGGVGINLTGADTVLFFDSDWNPALDKQCQDRAHRIGQTREVHIYRFVSEHTIEENMLKKANQKRMLDNVVIQEGEFTTDYFGKMDWRDMLGDDLLGTVERGSQSTNVALASAGPQSARQMERDMALAEDEDDRVAGAAAMEELEVDRDDFIEPAAAPPLVAEVAEPVVEPSPAVEGGDVEMGAPEGEVVEGREVEQVVEQEPEEEEEEEIGAVDDYMVKWVETDWEFFG